jgi:hypothetical protein
MNVFAQLARMIGIREDQVDDAITSERAARATLSRRGLLALGASAGAALVTGTTFSIPEPRMLVLSGQVVSWGSIEIRIDGRVFGGVKEIRWEKREFIAERIAFEQTSALPKVGKWGEG